MTRRQDWRPQWPPLITGPEKERLSRFREMLGRGDAPPSFVAEARWLLGLVLRLAEPRPDEFDFPEHAVLCNPISQSAFALRYARIEPFELFLEPPLYSFEKEFPCEAGDAFLLVRPYVRAGTARNSEAAHALRAACFRLEVDGEPVCPDEPLSRFLVWESGVAESRTAPLVRPDPRSAALYPAFGLHPNRTRGTLDGSAAPEIDGERPLGIFLPKNTIVRGRISYRFPVLPDVRLSAGGLTALYTTRG